MSLGSQSTPKPGVDTQRLRAMFRHWILASRPPGLEKPHAQRLSACKLGLIRQPRRPDPATPVAAHLALRLRRAWCPVLDTPGPCRLRQSWRLDRLGRNLKHLILFLEELQALGVDFVSLAEGIDATTPAGRLQMHILGAMAEFERARIAERVRLGLARVRAEGRTLGRPKVMLTENQLAGVSRLGIDGASRELGVSRSTLYRRLSQKST